MNCPKCYTFYSGSYCTLCDTKPEKKPKPINKVSKKRVEANKDYKLVRDAYLTQFPVCEVHNCGNKATEIHHKKGRVGELLTDIHHFLSVCHYCHRYIEINPIWAKENGYSENRTN